jgi:hypothetical protein
MQQRMQLPAHEEQATAASRELERLRQENAVLRSGTHPPSDLDRGLKVVYHRLSEAEHGGTTPISSLTLHVRRWTSVPMGLYTSSMPLRCLLEL